MPSAEARPGDLLQLVHEQPELKTDFSVSTKHRNVPSINAFSVVKIINETLILAQY